MATRGTSQSGYTLVELLVAITIMGIIMVPLTTGTVIAYRTMGLTSNSLTSSSDAQVLSVYLPADVKSADSAATTGTCTGVTVTNAKLYLTSLANAATALPAITVVYWVQSSLGAFQLVRSVCGSSPKSITVARNLALVGSAVASAVTVSSVVKGYSIAVTEKLVREPSAYTFSVSGRFRSGMPT